MSFLQTSVSEKASVQVAVRVRPKNARENGTESIVKTKGQSINIKEPETGKIKTFNYDCTYAEDSQQEDIYNNAGTYVISNAFRGYNTCVFAYGQTGSGKSHSVMGSDEQPGLIPRICQSLFDKQETHNGLDTKDASVTYKLEVSYLEIYSENVRDLLAHNAQASLRVREHPELGPYVEGLSQVLVENYRSIKKLIDQGNKERVTAATLMNSQSSRSHAILTLYFTQLIDEPDLGKTREVVSRINLVDLAGSERVELSGVTGINFKEAININKSLSSLGLVISKLATQTQELIKPKLKKPKATASTKPSRITTGKTLKTTKIPKAVSIADHIPYRDSVLTWILKESLGGNSKTFMIATVSPSELNYSESLSTLRYASNAKQIVNTVKVNEDPNDKLIRILKNEIEVLKKQLSSRGPDGYTPDDLTTLTDAISQREELMREKDKSWSQKLEESRLINEQMQEQLKREQLEFSKKLDLINVERENMLKEMETLKSSVDPRELEAEFQKKQAEFENSRIKVTAMSLHNDYEEKIEKVRESYERKIQEIATTKNEKAIHEINELKDINVKLKEELSRSQSSLQNQLKQFTNERLMFSKQMQVLHNKIHTMEQNMAQLTPITSEAELQLREEYNRIVLLKDEEEKKYQCLQTEYAQLDARINENKAELHSIQEKHNNNLKEVELKTADLDTLKAEYGSLTAKFQNDQIEYNNLLERKNTLHIEIDTLRRDLSAQVEIAKEKLKNPTIEDLLRIKDGLAKIFASIQSQQ